MDVGQIFEKTAAPPRREPDTRDNEIEKFSDYLDEPVEERDQAATPERPVETATDTPKPKSEPSDQVNAGPVAEESQTEDTMATAAAEPSQSKQDSASAPQVVPVQAGQSETAATSPTPQTAPAQTTSVDPNAIIAQTPVAGPAKVDKAGANSVHTPSSTDAPAGTSATTTAQPAPTKPVADTLPKGLVPTDAEITLAAAAQPQSAKPVKETSVKQEATADKPVTPAPTDTAVKAPPADALEKLRTEAMNKMTEKDVLSSKIAEMLADSKGKISLNPAATKSAFQSNLATSTNLVAATMASNNPAAAGVTVAAGITADALTGQVPVAQVASQAASPEIMPTPLPSTQAAVQGVDASAANTASQASNAARTMGHTPVAEQISMQISNAAKEGADKIKVSLHPSELGKVEIKMEVGHDGRVTAVISADKPETLDMLQRDARTLEKALQDAGFDTGSGGLNFGLSKEGGHEAPLDFAGNGAIEPELPADIIDTSALTAQTSTGTGDGNLDIQV
jgi:hypothetical protein